MKCSNVYFRDEMIERYKRHSIILYRFLTMFGCVIAILFIHLVKIDPYNFDASYVYKSTSIGMFISSLGVNFYKFILNNKIEYLKCLSINNQDRDKFIKTLEPTFADKIMFLIGIALFYIVVAILIINAILLTK